MFSFEIIAENFEVFENGIFYRTLLWIVGEREWNSVGFFVLWRLQCGFSIDFLGTMFAFFQKKAHCSYLLLKSDSSLQRRLSLRN